MSVQSLLFSVTRVFHSAQNTKPDLLACVTPPCPFNHYSSKSPGYLPLNSKYTQTHLFPNSDTHTFGRSSRSNGARTQIVRRECFDFAISLFTDTPIHPPKPNRFVGEFGVLGARWETERGQAAWELKRDRQCIDGLGRFTLSATVNLPRETPCVRWLLYRVPRAPEYAGGLLPSIEIRFFSQN